MEEYGLLRPLFFILFRVTYVVLFCPRWITSEICCERKEKMRYNPHHLTFKALKERRQLAPLYTAWMFLRVQGAAKILPNPSKQNLLMKSPHLMSLLQVLPPPRENLGLRPENLSAPLVLRDTKESP